VADLFRRCRRVAQGSRLGAVAETAGPRFRERIITPTKHWKMTVEDIHNSARRSDYLAALDDRST